MWRRATTARPTMAGAMQHGLYDKERAEVDAPLPFSELRGRTKAAALPQENAIHEVLLWVASRGAAGEANLQQMAAQ